MDLWIWIMIAIAAVGVLTGLAFLLVNRRAKRERAGPESSGEATPQA